MLRCGTLLPVPTFQPKAAVSPSFILSLFAIATAVVFFRPLLLGVAKALMLVVNPRRSRQQRPARVALRAVSLR